MITSIFFYLFAGASVAFALSVVSFRNPIYSALCLIGCLFSVAGIFALQSAQFLAILQILVYAGAIMVLMLFVLMLLNLSPEELGSAVVNGRKVLGAYLLVGVAVVMVVRLSTRPSAGAPRVADSFGSIEEIGRVLFTNYMLPFEMVSVLLLGAIIGAVILTRKSKGDGA